jgi:hypothetical protein
MIEYQHQEKLVSLEERIDEALDYRKELNKLEVREEERINNELIQRRNLERRRLEEKHRWQKEMSTIRLQEEENKLVINMRENYAILLKKNHLHLNEIRRKQTLERKHFTKLSEKQPEIKRQKELFQERNHILHLKKSGRKGSELFLEQIKARDMSLFKQKKWRQRYSKKLIEYGISKLSEQELPVNSRKPPKESYSVEQYLAQPAGEAHHASLCDLYDSCLEPASPPPHFKPAPGQSRRDALLALLEQ